MTIPSPRRCGPSPLVPPRLADAAILATHGFRDKDTCARMGRVPFQRAVGDVRPRCSRRRGMPRHPIRTASMARRPPGRSRRTRQVVRRGTIASQASHARATACSSARSSARRRASCRPSADATPPASMPAAAGPARSGMRASGSPRSTASTTASPATATSNSSRCGPAWSRGLRSIPEQPCLHCRGGVRGPHPSASRVAGFRPGQ